MSRPFRSLLPATTREDRGPPVGSRQKRKIRAQACEACRSYKSKCSGERPSCSKCLTRGAACRYVESEARQAKQKYEDLRKRQAAHDEVLSLIKTLPEQDAVGLFRRIRDGGDVGTILRHVRDGDLLLQLHLVPETRLRYDLPYSRDMPASLLTSRSPYLDSLLYEAIFQDGSLEYQSEYVKPYHAAMFVEPRLEKVTPSKWTTVCQDDTLMRGLLAAYFTHEYCLFPIFQKDYFLEDMAEPRTHQTPCCSASLVNAILAYACYCFKKIPNRFRYWEPESLGYRFLAEAKRIWEMQIVDRRYRNLASVQAAWIINIVVNLYGLDKVGDMYGFEGMAIAHELRLFDDDMDTSSERVRNARNFTAWGLYGIDCHFAWQLTHRPIRLEPPKISLPDPSDNVPWYGEIWMMHPYSKAQSPTYYGYLFKALCEFRALLGEICSVSFGTGSKITAEQAMAFVNRLTLWYKNLPIPLTSRNIVLPVHLLMHLDYQITLMIICQPFAGERWDDELVPKSIVSNAERDINILLRMYYSRHGFEDPHVYLLIPLVKLGFMSLNSINDQMPLEKLHYARSSLVLALKGLREQGRSYYVTRTVYHIIKHQLRPEEARLLQGAEDPESESDEVSGLEGEIQSAWTPTIVDISDDPSRGELSKLARQFLET